MPFIISVLAHFPFRKLIQSMNAILFGSIILAYISFPSYMRLRSNIPNQAISIIVSLLIAVIIILAPVAFLAFEVTRQGYDFYNPLSGKVEKRALYGFGCTSEDSKDCLLMNQAENFSVGY